MGQLTGIDETVIMAGTIYLHTFTASEEVAYKRFFISFDVVWCTVLLDGREICQALDIIASQCRFVDTILLPVDTLIQREMVIDSDFEGKVLTGTRRLDIHHDLWPVRLLGNRLLVILEDVQAKLSVYHSENFFKVIVIVQVLPLGNEPKAISAFPAVAKVHEEISPAGLAVVEVAAGLGVGIERVLELYASHDLAAKIMLEDL